jgi:hypothetical protein
LLKSEKFFGKFHVETNNFCLTVVHLDPTDSTNRFDRSNASDFVQPCFLNFKMTSESLMSVIPHFEGVRLITLALSLFNLVSVAIMEYLEIADSTRFITAGWYGLKGPKNPPRSLSGAMDFLFTIQ